MAYNSMLDTDDNGGVIAGSIGRDREPYWDEKIRWFKFPDDDQPYAYRLIGKPTYYMTHWVATKKKDGSFGKNMGVLCKNFDSATGTYKQNGCKICEVMGEFNKVYGEQKVEWAKWPKHIKDMKARATMSINAIVRELQTQGGPAGQADWTYVHPIRLPKGAADSVTNLAKKYNRKPGSKKEEENAFFGFNHAKEGKDIDIQYNSTAEAAKMYTIVPGPKSPLNEDEIAHSKFMVNFLEHLKYMADDKVEELMRRGGYYELLQGVSASGALDAAQKRAGIDTQPQAASEVPRSTPNTAPVQSAAAQNIPSALETDDSGGMTETEGDTPNQAVASTQSSQPATPPVQAPAQAAAPAVAGDSSGITEFSQRFGKTTKVADQDYSQLSLRTVKQGSIVPGCFASYSTTKQAQPEGCKACPVKLDCMQVEE